MAANPLVELGKAGQSPWLDYIDRELVASGGLARLVADDGIRGVTSNPTIFEKAIAGGHAYDGQIRALSARGATVMEAYKEIVTEDVRNGADVLRPVYDASGGADGYVSLEVDPDFAFDTGKTIARTEELFGAVGRPNVFIKIPATPEGLPAISEGIARGIPVNVTLIFSVERYGEVAGAYLDGLERLVAAGKDPRRVASVASFFVSRVDTAVDKLLDDAIARWPGSPRAETAMSLKGKAAIANAVLAYAKFREIVASPRWKSLAAKGARVQRPLWASTGTKNPKYPDTYYVDGLVGPDTVNTMPPQTMDAFRDHGTVAYRLDDGRAREAAAVVRDLGMLEIGIEDVCARLLDEGVKSFVGSYRKLLDSLAARLGKSAV